MFPSRILPALERQQQIWIVPHAVVLESAKVPDSTRHEALTSHIEGASFRRGAYVHWLARDFADS
jgi:hypothetical protein